MLIYVNENNEQIGTETNEPDWVIWNGVRTEEVYEDVENDEGEIVGRTLKDIILHCRKYTDEEKIKTKAYADAMIRQSQLQTAAVLFVNANTKALTDEQALSVSLLVDEWVKDAQYEKDQIIRYQDKLYRIGQDHTSQEQWIPGQAGTEALYSHIKINEEGYEEWKEWDGVSGIYNNGQIVTDPTDGKLYISKIPNNVWGPPSQQPSYWDLYEKG